MAVSPASSQEPKHHVRPRAPSTVSAMDPPGAVLGPREPRNEEDSCLPPGAPELVGSGGDCYHECARHCEGLPSSVVPGGLLKEVASRGARWVPSRRGRKQASGGGDSGCPGPTGTPLGLPPRRPVGVGVWSWGRLEHRHPRGTSLP